MKLLPMTITMQRHNTIVALGGMFLLLQVLSFIAHVRGSGRKADDVLQLEDNPCRPIPFNGRMIPTVPEYMPSFPGSVKGIKRHFVCRPEPTTTPTMTTQNPTSSSSTTKKSTTTSSSATKEPEASTISTMGSTTTDPPTTTTSSTTKEPEASTISTMGSTTKDPPTTTTSTTTTKAEATTISTMGSTATDPSITITSSTTKEPEATNISTMGSTTTDPPITTTSSTDRGSSIISTTDSTTSGSTTTTVSPTTQDTTTMSTTMESTTSNPTTRGEPTAKIFVTDVGTNSMFVADLQDELSFTSIPSSNKPRFITYDSVDNKIYWTDEDDRRVYRADVDGGNRETVTQEGSDERRGIAIAETSRTLYIANNGSKTITSLSIGEGSTIPGFETEFVSLDSEPISLEVDKEQQYLYWTETRGKIRRISLDGNRVTRDLYLNSDISELYGLSIGPSSGGSVYLFFCDFGVERSFYYAEEDGFISTHELTNHDLTASGYDTAGTKLRDITYFQGVLYWTKESDPSSITVMTDYQSARSYEIKETSAIVKPYQLLITTVYP